MEIYIHRTSFLMGVLKGELTSLPPIAVHANLLRIGEIYVSPLHGWLTRPEHPR